MKTGLTRSPSRKRHQSVTYREESPDAGFADNVSRMSQGYGAPASILKSGRKAKKTRPKTAQRARSGYNPSRGVGAAQRSMKQSQPINKDYSPKSANAGLGFSPYQVPNAAMIPTPSRMSNKQVSFAGNKMAMPKSPLPTSLTQGMGYLQEGRGRGGSPLRVSQSPRREESFTNLPPQMTA